MSDVVLQAREVCLDYDDGARVTHALRNVTLAVKAGEFVGIMGPSGSGKSSLLYLFSGLRRPTLGEILFRGKPWPFPIGRGAEQRRTSIGLVFQEPLLVPHWTIEENISAGNGSLPEGAVERVVEPLGISALLDEFPDRLSMGERQRASVARALVHRPALVLADEPTSALDTANGRSVMRALVHSAEQTAVVVCSHDRRMLSGADRVYSLEDGVITFPPSEDAGR